MVRWPSTTLEFYCCGTELIFVISVSTFWKILTEGFYGVVISPYSHADADVFVHIQ